jgi:hypothetical protein
MEAVKFYSVTENGQELQMLKSLLEAAALWEISTTRRNVYGGRACDADAEVASVKSNLCC